MGDEPQQPNDKGPWSAPEGRDPPAGEPRPGEGGPFHPDWAESTDHRDPGPLGYAKPGRGYVPSRLDEGARNAMIVGFVSFLGAFCCLGMVAGGWAIYEGIKARERIRRSNGELNGDGMAIAGIVCGAIGIVLSLGVIAYAAMYGPGGVRASATSPR